MTARDRSGPAYGCAAIGSAAVIISLWLPWYRFQIPDTVITQAEQLAKQLGGLGPLVQRGAELARQLGPLQVNAWDIFQQTDVVLLMVGVIAGGLAALAYSGSASGVARVILAAGAIGFVVTLHRVLSPPGPDGLLHPVRGAYIALLGTGLMIAGGAWARYAERPASAVGPWAVEAGAAPAYGSLGPPHQ